MPGRRSPPPGPRLPRGGPRAKPTPPRHFSASASRTEGGGASHTSCTENHTSRKPPRPRAVSGTATKACWAFQETPPPGAGSAEWLRQPTGASARTSRGSPPTGFGSTVARGPQTTLPGKGRGCQGTSGSFVCAHVCSAGTTTSLVPDENSLSPAEGLLSPRALLPRCPASVGFDYGAHLLRTVFPKCFVSGLAQ